MAHRRKTQLNLRRRLLILAVLGLLPAFAIILIDQFNTRSQSIADAEAYSLRMTEIVLGEVIRGMTGAATLMIGMRHSSELQERDGCEQYLAGIRQDVPSLVDLAIANTEGAIFCHSGSSALPDVATGVGKLMGAAATGGLQVGTYTATPEGAALPMAMAIPNLSGEGTSYIYLNVILTELERLVGAAMTGTPGAAIVADLNGTVLMRFPAGDLEPGDSLPAALAALAQGSEPATARAPGPDNAMLIVGYRPVTGAPPIAVFFGMEESQVLAPLDRTALVNTLVACLGATLAVLLAWLVGRWWVEQPVDGLSRAVSARRSGDKSARTGYADDGTEFGRIGSSIDLLFDELDDRERGQALAEEQRDLNAREVQHRVKNLLAVIQVIAKQTFIGTDLPEIRSFEGRIGAIVRANTALLAREGEAGEIADIAATSLKPFVGENVERIVLAGPTMRVSPKVSLALAMALYELATNAVKYGALSVAEGTVHVSWSIEVDRFRLIWSERNGPRVQDPDRAGFGTIMVKRVLAAETSGTVELNFHKGGLEYTLNCPLDRVLSSETPV